MAGRVAWWEGRNVQIEYRFGAGGADHAQALATALVASQPDVIFVQATPYSAAMQRQTRAIPIVFVGVYHGQPPIWMMLQPM